MENSKKERYELNESELQSITGGAQGELPAPRFPIGTPVLEDCFSQDIGQDSGEVVAYGWYENGEYSYVISWRIKGDRKYSEKEVERFYRCWDLSR